MIESLSISKVATYPEKPEIMNGLKSLNFIFGSNGTGKTTIGRVITAPSVFPGCSVAWKGGTPLQTLVYNSDFVERNFKPAEDLRGVFTLGEEQVGALEKITELKLERDALTKKIEGWNEASKGADGSGGKLMINIQRISAKKKESSQSIALESIRNVVTAIGALISSANASVTEHNRMVQNLSSERKTLTSQVWRLVVAEIKPDIAAYQAARGNLEKAIKGLGDQIQQATEDRSGKVKERRT